MDDIIGVQVTELPFKDIRKVADLTYYNGPLLSLFRDFEEQSYIYYWCDSDTMCNRWLVFGVSDDVLDGYIKQTITLYQLVTKPVDNQIFVVDIDGNGKHLSVIRTEPNILPDIYQPQVATCYDPSSTIIYDDEITVEFLSILVDEVNILRQSKKAPLTYSYGHYKGIQSPTNAQHNHNGWNSQDTEDLYINCNISNLKKNWLSFSGSTQHLQ